jgi:hypothetical protein
MERVKARSGVEDVKASSAGTGGHSANISEMASDGAELKRQARMAWRAAASAEYRRRARKHHRYQANWRNWMFSASMADR